MRYVAFLIALLFAGVSAPASGGTVPLDSEGFTDFLASAFQRALPDADVVVARPLTLEITLPNDPGGAHNAHLDALYDLCRREPDRCDRAVVVHLHDMTTSYAHQDDPPSRSALRVGVRPSAWVERLQKVWGDRPLPVRRLVGDLWVIGMIDMPTTIRALKASDIDTLQMTPEQALTAGADNIRADLTKSIRDLQRAAATSRNMLGFTGDAYMSSLLALDDIWPPIAKTMGGHVIAMAPAGDVLLVARDDDSGAIPALRKAGAEVMHGSLHPLSATVFRWSDKGWAVAAP